MAKQAPAKELNGVEGALALLRANGARITSSRRLLLTAIFATGGHCTAQQLAAAVQAVIPDVNMSTIYRNLDELERIGVVDRTFIGHGPAIYHLYPLTHGHLVCEGCGMVIESPDELLDGLSRAARLRFGFGVNPHHIVVGGFCRDCQSGPARAGRADSRPRAGWAEARGGAR